MGNSESNNSMNKQALSGEIGPTADLVRPGGGGGGPAAPHVIHIVNDGENVKSSKSASPLRMKSSDMKEVTLYWDIENMQIPKDVDPSAFVSLLKKEASKFGQLTRSKVFCDPNQLTSQTKSAILKAGLELLAVRDDKVNSSRELCDKGEFY